MIRQGFQGISMVRVPFQKTAFHEHSVESPETQQASSGSLLGIEQPEGAHSTYQVFVIELLRVPSSAIKKDLIE